VRKRFAAWRVQALRTKLAADASLAHGALAALKRRLACEGLSRLSGVARALPRRAFRAWERAARSLTCRLGAHAQRWHGGTALLARCLGKWRAALKKGLATHVLIRKINAFARKRRRQAAVRVLRGWRDFLQQRKGAAGRRTGVVWRLVRRRLYTGPLRAAVEQWHLYLRAAQHRLLTAPGRERLISSFTKRLADYDAAAVLRDWRSNAFRRGRVRRMLRRCAEIKRDFKLRKAFAKLKKLQRRFFFARKLARKVCAVSSTAQRRCALLHWHRRAQQRRCAAMGLRRALRHAVTMAWLAAFIRWREYARKVSLGRELLRLELLELDQCAGGIRNWA